GGRAGKRFEKKRKVAPPANIIWFPRKNLGWKFKKERAPPWYRHFYWRVPPWLTARAGQVIKRQSPLLPKAEIFLVPSNVRYWGQSGHGLLHCKCLLLTQSGHTSLEQ